WSAGVFIPRTKAIKRVAVSALTASFGGPSPVLADPQRARAGCRAIPAREVGGHPEENAPALGQPRAVQAITESDGQSRAPPQGPASIDLSEGLCSQPCVRDLDVSFGPVLFRNEQTASENSDHSPSTRRVSPIKNLDLNQITKSCDRLSCAFRVN